MTECYQNVLEFGRVQWRRVDSLARALGDLRRQASCDHRLTTLLRQCIFGLVLGYEVANDHDQLRHDRALQTACGHVVPLGVAAPSAESSDMSIGRRQWPCIKPWSISSSPRLLPHRTS